MRTHRFSLILLYLLTLAAVVGIIYLTFDYYQLSETVRPHHPQHQDWKPGGFIGHTLGFAGSILMIVLLLYSVRKRSKVLRNAGPIQYWLNYHIWMGITGPLLVVFHTALKFNGIVAVSFWSMVAVALSGFLGRYLYLQIPRMNNGLVMSASAIQQVRDARIESLTQRFTSLSDSELAHLREILTPPEKSSKVTLHSLFIANIKASFAVKKRLTIYAAEQGIKGRDKNFLFNSVHGLATFERKVSFLKYSQKMLHNWHIIHKPFAAVMYIIMLIHILVAFLFGYRWIF